MMLNPDSASLAPVGNSGNPTCLAVSGKGDQKESSSKKDLKIIQFSHPNTSFSLSTAQGPKRVSQVPFGSCALPSSSVCLRQRLHGSGSEAGPIPAG